MANQHINANNCNSGYTLIDNKCKKFPSNCGSCSKNLMCKECYSGYGLLLNENGIPTGYCALCPENCTNCQSDSSVCSDSNVKNACDKSCYTCDYNTGLCKRCELGYALVYEDIKSKTGFCVKCTESCSSCQSPTECYECKQGYTMMYDIYNVET